MSAEIHESAYCDEGARIGDGTRIWHFSHVCAGAVLGEGCTLGQNVYVGPGVRISVRRCDDRRRRVPRSVRLFHQCPHASRLCELQTGVSKDPYRELKAFFAEGVNEICRLCPTWEHAVLPTVSDRANHVNE